MTEMALTPAAFNTELRRWVKNVTGKSIGEVGGVARSTAYRQTQGDKLLSLEELLRIVELCVPRNLDPGQRDVFVRQNTTLWRRRWEIAYAARTGTAPEPVASPDVPGPRSPVTGSIPITGAIPVVGGVPRLRFPRARVARLFDTELAHGSWPLADLLQEWGAQERSNLFFISGSSGSGKSTEAQLWAAGQRDAAYVRLLEGPVDFVRLAEEGSERQVVVIDDFDLVSSLAEAPGARPDLSELRGFFARGGRCVVLSKRNLQTDSDELAEQLRSTSRLHDLGVVEPVSVRVLPVSADELDELAAKRDDARLADLATVLGGSRGRMLATPL
ncbi:MAG: hypothetical protein J2O46_10400, partial [Nocardioides sp.]|nr:hypothetical protein [Nocardioides sp.]